MAAEAVLLALDESGVLGAAVAREAGMALLPIEARRFEGGEFKLRPLQSVRGRDTFVVQSLAASPAVPVCERLVRLLFLLQGLHDAGARSTTVLVPYLAFARKDRRTQLRDPVSARYVAELLEAAHADAVIGLDVHNPAAFDNAFRVPTVHLTAIPMMAAHFVAQSPSARLAVVSPDVGGIKRAQIFREQLIAHLGREVELAFVTKRRAKDVVSSGSLLGDVTGCTVIVLDDLCATGGTLIRAAHACRRAGAESVYVAVTHAPQRSGLDALAAAEAIRGIVVTDSVGLDVPTVDGAQASGKLVTLSVAPLLGQLVQRMASGVPVAPLLEQWPVRPGE